jgi:hypothetical protein
MVYRTYDICLLFPESRQSGVVLNLSLSIVSSVSASAAAVLTFWMKT